MAETASILCPGKKVLMPDPNAGCPLADTVTVEELRAVKNKHPGAAVLSYVNTSAAVKAESDICCTSANAASVAGSLSKEKEIIFVPDKHLGDYVSRKISRKLILWDGFCPTHENILPEDILDKKKAHPGAKVIVHPECTRAVVNLADAVLSTGGMCKYASNSDAPLIIVGTEIGMLHRLRRENPRKEFYPASEKAVCPTMKLTTPEKIVSCLQEMKYEVKVPDDVRVRAKKPLDRMLEAK